MRRFSLWILLSLVLMALALPIAAQEATEEPTAEVTPEVMEEATANAYLRVAHFAPDAPEVAVFIDGEPSAIQTLSFPEASGWVEVPAGTYSVAVVPVGSDIADAAIGPVSLTFAANTWTTVAAVGLLADGSLDAAVYTEDYLSLLDSDSARVTVFHAIPGAPAVDVRLADGTVLVENLAYTSSATLDVPAGAYDLQVVATGTDTVLLDLGGTEVVGNNFTLLAAVGTSDAPAIYAESVEYPRVEPLIRAALDRTGTGTILEVASSDGRFTTLVNVIELTGLTTTLNSAGPFTVFAPTDAAFDALGEETINALIGDPATLQSILLYHVVSGSVTASEVVELTSATTVNGAPISISVIDGNVFLNDTVQVILTDVFASNGVIHVIDAVLLPPA